MPTPPPQAPAPRALLFALVALVVGAPASAAAQVTAEVLRPNPLRPGWSGGLDVSLALARGNIELFDVGAAGRVQYQTLHPPRAAPGEEGGLPFFRHRAYLTANARFAERAASAFINQGFLHARWTAMWHRRLGSDLFAQYQFNEFWRLRARALVGAGLRAEIFHLPWFTMWAGSAYMLEYNRIDVLPGARDRPETFEHRWTNYLAFRIAGPEGRVLLQSTLYLQPRWDAFDDFRLLEEVELVVKASDLFALVGTLSVLHDNGPPTGVKPTDLRLATTVRLSF